MMMMMMMMMMMIMMMNDDNVFICPGVGKTMLTAAVVRDERVRRGFECIACEQLNVMSIVTLISVLVLLGINLSQQPDLLQLQKRLYQQLHVDKNKMPDKADSIEAQCDQRKQLCLNRVVLCILGG